MSQFSRIRYSDVIGTVKAVICAGRQAYRVCILGIAHEVSGHDVQINGEYLSVKLRNAVKIRFQSVMILNIAVPGYRIIFQILCFGDIFSYVNIRNGFGFSMIGICNGEGEFLLLYLRFLNRITKK